MKILVITDLYPIKEDEKHTPKTIFNFVKSWEKLGHEVKVIKPNFILNSFVRKKPFYKSGVYKNVENINYFLPFMGDIKEKIKTQFNPDLLIAHMPSGLIFADKLNLSCPFCAGVHISDIEVLTNPIYKVYFKPSLEQAYSKASKIACRSEVLRRKFLTLYPQFEKKCFVANSGIDNPILRKWNGNQKIKVLTCGQFIKRKNIDKVIRACDKFENIELTVIGEGKEKLREISNKPIFLGQIPHNQVLEKMRESDIFILPSKNETFGMVYLEAMSSGCVTVCSKNDGIDGIIRDGENGFLCENVEETLIKVINFPNKDEILNQAYKTILNLGTLQVAENYLRECGF
jgi:glycosyltransferase involved in cell wall biosynthesis